MESNYSFLRTVWFKTIIPKNLFDWPRQWIFIPRMGIIQLHCWYTRAHSFVFISRETDNPHSARSDAMQRLKAFTLSAVPLDMMSVISHISPVWRTLGTPLQNSHILALLYKRWMYSNPCYFFDRLLRFSGIFVRTK